MQSFSRGWSFLKEAWQMAFKDRDLIKPSIYSLFVGIIVSVIFLIPMIGSAVLFGDRALGQVLMVVFGAVLIFAQYSVGYIFSAMTIYLVYGYLAEGDGVMSKAWEIVRREWLNILSLAAASTAVNLLRNAIRGRGRSGGRNLLSGLIGTVWTEAAFLILPAMVIEGVNLKDALKRAGQIVKDNLLLVGISTVGVRAINGLIGFLLGAVGIALGPGGRAGHHLADQQFDPGDPADPWDRRRDRAGRDPGGHLHHGCHHRHLVHFHGLPHLPVSVGA